MPEITGPKFACASCGKEYKWKPELAGKKGKCKCGGVLSIPPEPPDEPEPGVDAFDDLYGVTDDAPKQAPSHAPPPTHLPAAAPAVPAPARARGGTVYAPPPPPDPDAPAPMNVMGSLKWLGLGLLIGAFAFVELNWPTDPDAPARKWRAILKLANNVHPRGSFVALALMSAFLLLCGVLVLLGKMTDDDTA